MRKRKRGKNEGTYGKDDGKVDVDDRGTHRRHDADEGTNDGLLRARGSKTQKRRKRERLG